MTQSAEDGQMREDAICLRLGQAILLTCAFIVVQLALGLLAGIIFILAGLGMPSLSWGMGAVNLVSFGILAGWVSLARKQPHGRLFSFAPFPAALLAPMVLSVAGLSILASEMGNVLHYFLPSPQFLRVLFKTVTNGDVGSYVTVIVIAPVTEELLYRGIILKGLMGRYNAALAVVLSAVLFSLSHLVPYQFFAGFSMGAILGWLFVRTDSLWPCIICHAMNNLMTVLVVPLLPVGIPGYNLGPVEGGAAVFQPIWFDVAGVAILAAGLWGMAMVSRKNAVSSEPAGAVA